VFWSRLDPFLIIWSSGFACGITNYRRNRTNLLILIFLFLKHEHLNHNIITEQLKLSGRYQILIINQCLAPDPCGSVPVFTDDISAYESGFRSRIRFLSFVSDLNFYIFYQY